MVADAPARGTYPGRGLHGEVVERLGRRIVAGQPAPGEALPQEPVLAAQFDVSRTVVREALRVLAAKGLVDARPMRGTRVRPRGEWRQLDPDVLRWALGTEHRAGLVHHLLEIRNIVEPSAARLAAERGGRAQHRQLEERLADLVDASDDTERFIEADLALHATVFAMSQNPLLGELIAPIGAALREGRRIQAAGAEARSVSGSLAAHAAVVAAITQGYADAAETAMRELVQAAAEDAARALPPAAQARA